MASEVRFKKIENGKIIGGVITLTTRRKFYKSDDDYAKDIIIAKKLKSQMGLWYNQLVEECNEKGYTLNKEIMVPYMKGKIYSLPVNEVPHLFHQHIYIYIYYIYYIYISQKTCSWIADNGKEGSSDVEQFAIPSPIISKTYHFIIALLISLNFNIGIFL